MYINNNISNWETDTSIKDKLTLAFEERKFKFEEDTFIVSTPNVYLNELYNCINENAWISFFLDESIHIAGNWIDFEAEISKVIQELDLIRHTISQTNYFENTGKGELIMLMIKLTKSSTRDVLSNLSSIDKFALRLYDDLNKLIRALEIYLSVFVKDIQCKVISPDIKELHIDKVLSFNYTDTFKKLYDPKGISEYDYIHGIATCDSTTATNNMVLGIDEYLPKEIMNKEVEFIAFKKYYQRIYKGTGLKYREWVDEIKSNAKIQNLTRTGFDDKGEMIKTYTASSHHNLYIFGHSLDITDNDVLKDLILNDNVKTKVFYNAYNGDNGRKSLAEKITNLVKIIGQEELIRKTGGKNRTIEFKLQHDMNNLT